MAKNCRGRSAGRGKGQPKQDRTEHDSVQLFAVIPIGDKGEHAAATQLAIERLSPLTESLLRVCESPSFVLACQKTLSDGPVRVRFDKIHPVPLRPLYPTVSAASRHTRWRPRDRSSSKSTTTIGHDSKNRSSQFEKARDSAFPELDRGPTMRGYTGIQTYRTYSSIQVVSSRFVQSPSIIVSTPLHHPR